MVHSSLLIGSLLFALVFNGCLSSTLSMQNLAAALNIAIPANPDNCMNWASLGVTCLDEATPLEIRWDSSSISGSLIDNAGPFPALTLFYLRNTNTAGIIPNGLFTATNFPRLETIALFTNPQITGTIPVNIFTLPKLTTLALTLMDGLTGPLTPPPDIISPLNILEISYTKVNGAIPQQFGSISSLTSLSLNFNSFSGPIPPELSALSNLQILSLMGNNLSGEIPAEFAQLTKLQTLRLSSNPLTGPIPSIFGNMASLAIFESSQAQLAGTIPSDLANLHSLTSVIVHTNQLEGEIPPFAGPLTELVVGSNRLNGTFPQWIAQKSSLQTLVMANNPLSGTLPSLAQLTNLLQFDVSNTPLSGCWTSTIAAIVCNVKDTQLCCAPQICLPLTGTCYPGETTFDGEVTVDDIDMDDSTTITIANGATINVTGDACVQFDGKLIVEIDYKALDLTLEQFAVMYYSCFNGSFDSVAFKEVNGGSCSLTPEIEYGPKTLSVILPQAGECSENALPPWAIAVIVVGGLVIVTGVILLALYLSPVREKVFPYAKRT